MEAILSLLSDPRVVAIVAPLLIAAVKKLTDKLPSWSLPVLSTVLGAIMAAIGGGELATGAVAGLAGVGVREVLDQGKKAVSK